MSAEVAYFFCSVRGWKFALSTLPALQNQSQRSLSSYQSRIIR